MWRAGAAVADNANVSNVLGEIALHKASWLWRPQSGRRGEVRPAEFGRGPAPGKLELREENVATAPGSPWGGSEGPAKYPWSDLLTTRMLAQGKSRSNALRNKSENPPSCHLVRVD